MHLPNGWNDWLFWQVGQFKFRGGTKLDGNVYSANMDKLRLERQRSMKLDDGAKWTPTKSVQTDLSGYDGTEVRYANEGQPFGPWLPYKRRFDLKLSDKQGKQDVRLQLRSFRNIKSPVLPETIYLDSVPPTMWGPLVSIRGGVRIQRSGARVPTVVQMGARDDTSGLDSSSLRAVCGGTTRASDSSASGSARLTVQINRRNCTLKGTATDAVGHRTTKTLGPTIGLFDVRQGSGRVRFKGDWKTLKNKNSLGRSLARTATRGATAKLAFEGAQFAIVARRGPAGGRFKVILDGKHVDTVSLYAKTGDSRRIVYVRKVPKGKHEVKLRATGTSSAGSSGAIVWLDAILVLDRRK